MSRRVLAVLSACVCLLAAGLAAWWYLHSSGSEYRFRRAQAAIRAGDYQAGEATAAAFEADGHREESVLLRAEALLLRAEAQKRTDESAAALALLHNIPADSSRMIEAAALSGRCLLRLGKLLEAEQTFEYVLTQDPDCVDAHRGLMAVYYDLGALTVAIEHAQQWAERVPRDGRPHRFIALMRKDLGHYREAIAPYRQALERELSEQVRAEASIELAECLIRAGEFAQAEEILDASRPPAELFARVLTAQAECERSLGRSEAARELVARALEAQPQYTEALRASAQLALDAGDLARAVRELERAAVLKPNEFDTYHLLGRAYAQLGDEKNAQAAQQRVKGIQDDLEQLTTLTRELMNRPKNAALHRKIADVFSRLSMPEMAATRRRVAADLEQAAAHASAAAPLP